MSKKDLATIVLKTIIFLCSALLAVLGVSAVTSCAYARNTAVNGRATIVTIDTTYIDHTSTLKYPKK